MYVSFLAILGALYLNVFEQPANRAFFSNLLETLKSVYIGPYYPGRAGVFSCVPRPPEAARSPGLVRQTQGGLVFSRCIYRGVLFK
jgi:hypothetical protein